MGDSFNIIFNILACSWRLLDIIDIHFITILWRTTPRKKGQYDLGDFRVVYILAVFDSPDYFNDQHRGQRKRPRHNNEGFPLDELNVEARVVWPYQWCTTNGRDESTIQLMFVVQRHIKNYDYGLRWKVLSILVDFDNLKKNWYTLFIRSLYCLFHYNPYLLSFVPNYK